jgi:hypothetical protein
MIDQIDLGIDSSFYKSYINLINMNGEGHPEWISILSSQRNELLKDKKKLKFWGRLFFRRYTDWIKTNEIKKYTKVVYIPEGNILFFDVPIRRHTYVEKYEVWAKGNLKNGEISYKENFLGTGNYQKH